MTPLKQFRLLLMLALLASGLGFAWIVLQVDDSAPVEPAARSPAPDAVTVPHDAPQAVTTEARKQIGPTAKTTIEIPASDRLVGRIVDVEGKGLIGITVRLRTLRRANRGFFLRQAVTDASGDFVLEDLDRDSVYMLFTEAAAEYPSYRLDGFILSSLPTPFEIRLLRLDLVDVEGTVVDAEHAPVANFTLTIDNLETNYPSRTVTSDASGYFRLDAFPAGKLKMYTATPEYFRILGLHTRSDEYRNLTLVIDRGRYQLVGRVLDKGGVPIASTRITLKSVIAGNDYHSHAYRMRRTDASGNFVFSDLGGVPHTLGVYANGHRPHIEDLVFQNFSERLEIRLRD